MNFKFHYILSIFLILTLSFSAFSQQQELNKADKAYTDYDYINAREIYIKVTEKGYEDPELYIKIANSFYFNAKYDEALNWYNKLFELDEETISSENLLRYAQSLKASGYEQKSKKYYDKYLKKSGIPLEGKKLSSVDYLKIIKANSGRYEISSLDAINTDDIEFGKAIYDGKLVYASNHTKVGFLKRKNGWNDAYFLDLYQVDVNGTKVVGKPKKLPGDVNKEYHESSAIITKDGKTMYFTRSNSNPKKKNKDQHLKIYRAHLIDGQWTQIEDLPINSDDYSTAHPALDSLETRLYFSSDKPGGYGNSDLYVASIGKSGSIGVAENLGPKINTKGKETFPFISDQNELYFSSDGHFGLGGMDIFRIKIKAFGFGELLNVGKPINSYADDFAFGINSNTRKGFFSSNRALKESMNNDNEGHQLFINAKHL